VNVLRLLVAAGLAALGLVVLTPAGAHACFCVLGSDHEQVRRADAVFVGTFTRYVASPTGQRIPDDQLTTYQLDVDWVLAGDVHATTDVTSATGCGLERMEVGRSYVVFATRVDSVLWSWSCSGTGPASPGRIAEIERVTGPGRLMWSFPPRLVSIPFF
jgi:hypothetical protein